MEKINYQDINARTVDRWIEEGWEWGKSISHEVYERAKVGDYSLLLTPSIPLPKDWIGDVKGKKILGLASGGGQQMPVLTALGADCTVLDYSSRQCESERAVAEREGYKIQVIQGDMTKPLPFEDETFDIIIHPVSNCYIEDPCPVFRECFRILKKGGRLLSGLDNGMNYIFDEEERVIAHKLPFNPLKNPEYMEELIKSDAGVQFSHTADEQLGGQLKAGFLLKDIFEDYNTEGNLHDMHIPSFWATYAIKPKTLI